MCFGNSQKMALKLKNSLNIQGNVFFRIITCRWQEISRMQDFISFIPEHLAM
jgi:hypothetical protein